MSNRIWSGRCEDCYDISELHKVSDDTIPKGMCVELCEKCHNKRKSMQQQEIPPPPVGLLLSDVWQDTPPIIIVKGSERIQVAVKFIPKGEYAGIIRLCFDISVPQWFAAGVFGRSAAIARSEARSFLRMFYFQNAPLVFE